MASEALPERPPWQLFLISAGLYGALAEAVVMVTSFSTSHGAPFWPGAGVTAGLLLCVRYARWPAVVVGVAVAEIVVDVANDFGLLTALGWAAANTIEAMVGAWLYRRAGRVTVPLQEVRVMARFVRCSVLVGPLVGAVIGSVWATLVSGDPLLPRLPRWFVGDAMGVLVVAPLFLGLAGRGVGRSTWALRVATWAGLMLVAFLSVGPWEFSASWGLPFLAVAALVLGATWQGHGWAVVGVLTVATVTEVSTAIGHGPFAVPGAFEGLVVAQMFLAACAVTALLAAALVDDLLSREEVELVLRQQALHDALTGVANRRLLDERYEQAATRAEREGAAIGLAVVDLDGFKAVNDRYGHAAGDAVLVEAARRLGEQVRAQDTVARIGGDEFAVLLDGVEDDAATDALVARIEQTLSRPVLWEGYEVPITATVGVVVARSRVPLDDLTSQADGLMYAAKPARAVSP